MSPHCCAVCVTEPPAHAPLYPPPLPDSFVPRHAAGMPAKAAPPLKTSGYSASRSSVIMPPDESPVA